MERCSPRGAPQKPDGDEPVRSPKNTSDVNNYIKYDTQSLADPQEEEDVPASSGVVAARSKAKAKPQPREYYVGTTATIPIQ